MENRASPCCNFPTLFFHYLVIFPSFSANQRLPFQRCTDFLALWTPLGFSLYLFRACRWSLSAWIILVQAWRIARFAPVQSRFHCGQFLVRDAVGMRRCRRALLALGIRRGKQRLSRSRHCWMRSCAELENPTALPRPRRAPKGSAPPASRVNERRLRPSPTCSPPAIGGRSVPPWRFPLDRRGTLLAAN